MRERSREQKLVDIMFQMIMMIHDKEYGKSLRKATREELAAWAVHQLKECGFPTYEAGCSWAVLDTRPSDK